MSGIDWGDAPTWFGSVFAAAAASFAYMTIKSQREQIEEQRIFIAEQSETLQLEREALRAAAVDRRETQARTVRVYIPSSSHLLRVHNDSNSPIHDVTGVCGDVTALVAEEMDSMCRDTDSRVGDVRGGERVPVSLMGAGRSYAFSRPDTALVWTGALFTDNDGVRWSLDLNGQLQEVAASREE
ncbi:hypothetical protein AB0B07_09495 [Streptomyces sioyaensis]|uniref:hypothetical protein n=1 Tax=Streptomyces sioyaensis TaxID=67364 RepID=UPI00340D5E06